MSSRLKRLFPLNGSNWSTNMWTVITIAILSSTLHHNVLSLSSKSATGETTKSETCEYDIDLTKNTIKITCEGSPSMVNVYAERALVQGDEKPEAPKDGEDYKRHVMGELNSPTTRAPRGPTPRRPTPQAGAHSRPTTGYPTVHRAHHEPPSRATDHFSQVVLNATQKLEHAKRSFSIYADSIRNISGQLTEGDANLKQDMERLRSTSNSATDLKEGIIAAMSNQYNYMRSALLTRNFELERLVTSLLVLVDATSDGLRSALKAQNSSMEQIEDISATLSSVRKMVARELKKRSSVKKNSDKNQGKEANVKGECPKVISAIGSGSCSKWDREPVGSYMVESVNPSEYRPVYIMLGHSASDQLLQFDTQADVDYKLVTTYIALPFFCVGTGHAVYRRHFYCQKQGTNMIVKYHLKKMDIVSELVLPGATFGNVFPYSSGVDTDVDLAVDEYGLWAIYATEASAGKMVVSKIDHKEMEILKTWMTSYPKKHIGNAFMICGTLYATNSHKDAPTFVKYMFNTDTGTEKFLERGELPFPNSALLGMVAPDEGQKTNKSANSVMLGYDFRTAELHSWSNGRIERFPVYFREL
ncbi:unnamed protein product [Lymnaea stagnalis]|uniref:Olfactomedin-like domain-containing protein n=1 Tax=Lymnaea stagnalis TaxID=6523 RepID=A0AAV2HSH0_LYMST